VTLAAAAAILPPACQARSAAAVFGVRAAGRVSPNNALAAPRDHRPAKGWVIVIHGGGWLQVGRQFLATAAARYFQRLGWGTYTIDYRPGELSFWDTLAAYDLLRSHLGRQTPVSAWGASAGGTLAMLLAAVRPDLDAAISEAGPTDLVSLGSQPAYAGPGVAGSLAGPANVQAAARAAFGSDRLWDWSPVRVAGLIDIPLLAVGSGWDPLVPDRQQLAEIKRARPATQTMLLAGAPNPPDGAGFANMTHASVTLAALRSYHAAIRRLLVRAVARAAARAR
jgi:acetyl esterase/lipase